MSETIRWAGDGSDGPWNADAMIEFQADRWLTPLVGRVSDLLQKGRPGSFRMLNEGWIDWAAGERSVSANTMVQVRFACGVIVTGRADTFEWGRPGSYGNIVAYRLHPVAGSATSDADWIDWYGETGLNGPVFPGSTRVDVKLRNGTFKIGEAGAFRWSDMGAPDDIVAYREAAFGPPKFDGSEGSKWVHSCGADLGKTTICYSDKCPSCGMCRADGYQLGSAPTTTISNPKAAGPSAPSILDRAAGHMRDRAATYDQPDGERSMGKTVAAFNAVTGRDLRESEGWLLMDLLKMVRSEQRRAPHADSIEDLVAYSALYGEARMGGK